MRKVLTLKLCYSTISQLKNYFSILAPIEPISLRSLRSKIKAIAGLNVLKNEIVLLLILKK